MEITSMFLEFPELMQVQPMQTKKLINYYSFAEELVGGDQ
jgi:hypothetical protein